MQLNLDNVKTVQLLQTNTEGAFIHIVYNDNKEDVKLFYPAGDINTCMAVFKKIQEALYNFYPKAHILYDKSGTYEYDKQGQITMYNEKGERIAVV